MRIIYEPRGRALEYAPLAVSLYRGCSHGCVYCFAPASTNTEREKFLQPYPRKDALKKLKLDAKDLAAAGDQREILMSFTTDPYQPLEDKCHLTQGAIKIFNQYGLHYTPLTKGFRPLRDINLMEERPDLCRFGTTLVFSNEEDQVKWEPLALDTKNRIDALWGAMKHGIRTWASIEPPIYPVQSLELIQWAAPYCDEFRIGKFNHTDNPELKRFLDSIGYTYPTDQEWTQFVIDAKRDLDDLGKRYIFKKDLQPNLQAAGICTKINCETNPWNCEIPFEKMQCECLHEIMDDLINDHNMDEWPDTLSL